MDFINCKNCSLSQFIDFFVAKRMWNPNSSDDENIDKIIKLFGSKGNYNVMRWLIIEDITRKLECGFFVMDEK